LEKKSTEGRKEILARKELGSLARKEDSPDREQKRMVRQDGKGKLN